jgi:hypothetical protein
LDSVPTNLSEQCDDKATAPVVGMKADGIGATPLPLTAARIIVRWGGVSRKIMSPILGCHVDCTLEDEMAAQLAVGVGRGSLKGFRLKYLLLGAVALLFMSAEIPAANAVVCARGVYRAGCAGPRGAVVTHRPAARCYYRAGRRVCVR